MCALWASRQMPAPPLAPAPPRSRDESTERPRTGTGMTLDRQAAAIIVA
jgi:hypothetical protein